MCVCGFTQGTLYTTTTIYGVLVHQEYVAVSCGYDTVTIIFRFTSIFHTYEKLVVQKMHSYDCE